PDSRSIGFFANGKLKRVELGGGEPQTICATSSSGRPEGTWSRDGVILFSSNDHSPLYRVSAAGGEATPATVLDTTRQERLHAWPRFLPDGRHYLFVIRSSRSENTG